MERLDKVYRQILLHYEVEADMEEVFEALKLHIHPTQNKIKRKRTAKGDASYDDDDEETEDPSQKTRSGR